MARSQDRALYDQFQRADALKQERPRDPRLHVSAAWRRIVCVKPDSTSTQVERNAGASLHGSACIYVAEMELELEGSETSTALEMAQISYLLNDYMTVGAGKFLNPADYFVERQHMAWVNKLPNKPLAVYDGLMPESLLGVQVRGAIPVGPTKIGYAFFAANAPTLTTTPADPANPIELGTLSFDNFDNSNGHISVGGRVGFYPMPQLEIGYGFQTAAVGPRGSDVNALLQSVDLSYVRDSDVRKEVERRADGRCEFCGQPGFHRKDGSKYVETHHIIALAKDGADRVTNVIGLCPNHHKEAHFGSQSKELEQQMIVIVRKFYERQS